MAQPTDPVFQETFWIGEPGDDPETWSLAESHLSAAEYTGLAGPALGEEADMKKFAATIEKYARPNDTIWICGYPLLPLPAMIRTLFPEITIGFFLDSSFPSYETFRERPGQQQEDVLRGMLGADLIGFDNPNDVAHFLQCILLIFGLENEVNNNVRYEDRLIKVDSFPIPRLAAGQDKIRNYDLQAWTNSFLRQLQLARKMQQDFQVRFFDVYSRNQLMDKYRSARRRLFLLDYDGTLTPFFNLPSLAKPDNLLLDILNNIGRNERNSVYIVSGRDSATLDKWLGHLPVNIIAEHGARIRYKNGRWQDEATQAIHWKDAIERVMEVYTRKCVSSFVEVKEYSIVWHYRNARPEQAGAVKMELFAALCKATDNTDLQVTMGNKIIEVRNKEADKGAAIGKVLAREKQDFILAIGDDRTDEDMFRMLAGMETAYTIKVGTEASFAQFNMHTPQMVISLLGNMNFLEQQSWK